MKLGSEIMRKILNFASFEAKKFSPPFRLEAKITKLKRSEKFKVEKSKKSERKRKKQKKQKKQKKFFFNAVFQYTVTVTIYTKLTYDKCGG
jgi:hypothetical protein